jgi:hypothetical protein
MKALYGFHQGTRCMGAETEEKVLDIGADESLRRYL